MTVRPAQWSLAVLGLLTSVHLLAQVSSADVLADVTQCLLMPAVAAVLLTRTREPRSRLVRLTTLALFFSWLGDTLPRFTSGDPAFLLMVAGFLVAQILYVRAFWPRRGHSVLATRRWLLAPAGVAVVVMVVLAAVQAPLLAAPVGLYAAALLGMVLVGTGLATPVALGAVVFLVSDTLIGLDAFTELALPGHGFWVMLTYVVGQTLITLGVARQDHLDRATSPGLSAGQLSPRQLG